MHDMHGFASFSADGLWGEVGGIGFDEEAFKGDACRGFAQFLCLWKGDVSRERDVQPHGETRARECGIAAKTMHDAAVGIEMGFEWFGDFEEILLGFAAVDDDGHFEARRHVELTGEGFALVFFWGEQVMVIEADFADGDHFWFGRERRDCGELFGAGV